MSISSSTVYKGLVSSALVLLAAGCATPVSKPAFYPNAFYQKMGAAQATADYDSCNQLAKDSNLSTVSKADVMKNSATGAATVGIGAAVGSAILGGSLDWRQLTAGVGAVAAGSAAGTAVNQSIGGNETYKNFVSACLTEKGYQLIGWQ